MLTVLLSIKLLFSVIIVFAALLVDKQPGELNVDSPLEF